MTIKDITVKTKPFTFQPGDVVYTCEFFGGKTLTVLAPVQNDNGVKKVKVLCTAQDGNYQYAVGREDYIFPGDLGVPGYAYDNRKCSLFRSKIAADAHAGVYAGWLERNPPFDHGNWSIYY